MNALACVVGLALTGSTPTARLVIPSPDRHDPCAAATGLRSAIARRIPGTRVIAGAVPEGDDLRVTLFLENEQWRLVIDRANGTRVINRTINRVDAPCGTVIDASVLILDRYLDEISWPGRDPRITAGALAEPASFEVVSAPAIQLSLPNLLFHRLVVSAGPAAWFGTTANAAGGLSFDLAGRFGSRWLSALTVSVSQKEQTPAFADVDGGTQEERGLLETRFAGGTMIFSGCTLPHRVEGCLGATAGVVAVWGNGEGAALYRQRSQWVLLPTFGLSGRVNVQLGLGLELTAEVKGITRWGQATVGVQGTSAQKQIPEIIGLFSGMLGWRTYR